MSKDHVWTPGPVPDPSEQDAVRPPAAPVAPYASRGISQPYGSPVVPTSPVPPDPYAFSSPAQQAGGSFAAAPSSLQHPPGAYPQPPYPSQQYPQPYVTGAYGQRSAYGEYAPTSYGAGGYQPMPFTALPPLAEFGARVGASLIDSIVPVVLVTIGFIPLFVMTEPAFDDFGRRTQQPTAAAFLIFVGFYLAMAAFSIWNRVFRQGRTGQSIGKSALRIRLVREATMAPPGAALSFGRELAHYIDGTLYIGYLWPLWDPKNQTLADKICGTVVVADG